MPKWLIAPGLLAAAGLLIGVGQAGARSSSLICGDTITRNLVLTGDLDCSAAGTDGLHVGASGITLDLGGHTITGSGGGAGQYGIVSDGYNRVTITNGTIE